VVGRFGGSTATQIVALPRAPGGSRSTRGRLARVGDVPEGGVPLDIPRDARRRKPNSGTCTATDTNTVGGRAKFEICAHRYLHVAEPGYGVAVVNDSTYGHDVTRTVRRTADHHHRPAALLRGPATRSGHRPGVHRIAYALVPGADLVDATGRGCGLNLPERRLPGDAVVDAAGAREPDGVVVSAVKLADDGSDDIVVRLTRLWVPGCGAASSSASRRPR